MLQLCHSMLQNVGVCCRVLAYVQSSETDTNLVPVCYNYVVVCCSALWCVTACCSMLQLCYRVLQHLAVCCSVLQCANTCPLIGDMTHGNCRVVLQCVVVC